jgi:hypothetical protein
MSSQQLESVDAPVSNGTQPVKRISKNARKKLTKSTIDAIADELALTDTRALSAQAASIIRAQISSVVDQVAAKFGQTSPPQSLKSKPPKPAAASAQKKPVDGSTHGQPVPESASVSSKASSTVSSHSSHTDDLFQTVQRLEAELSLIRQQQSQAPAFRPYPQTPPAGYYPPSGYTPYAPQPMPPYSSGMMPPMSSLFPRSH